MSWIYPNKKKERTPEQKRQRGLGALVVIATAVFFILITPSPKKNQKAEAKFISEQEMAMEAVLDSLIQNITQQPYEIYHKGEMEILPLIPEFQEEYDLVRVKTRIAMLLNDDIPFENRDEELELALGEEKRLQERINAFKEEGYGVIKFYGRRIKFQTEDGHKYTFYQQHFADLDVAKFIADITDKANIEKEYKRLENNLNNNAEQ